MRLVLFIAWAVLLVGVRGPLGAGGQLATLAGFVLGGLMMRLDMKAMARTATGARGQQP